MERSRVKDAGDEVEGPEMNAQPLELEGTWEEIMQHAGELAGRQMKLIVLPMSEVSHQPLPEHSAAAALSEFVGGWEGDDFPELLEDVYRNCSQAKF